MLAMLKIRLKRVGRKHDPSYRIVVVESTTGPKSGKYVEMLGFYDPIRKIREIKGDRVKHWTSVGAQVSDTVHNILVAEGIIEGKKINVLPKKKPIVKEQPVEEKKEASAESVAEVVTDEATESKPEEKTEEALKEEEKPVKETPKIGAEETVEEKKEDTEEKLD
jgi:small subunit ribosomal protein S16